MKHWNWDNLRFLIALADQGTLTSAASQLNVSHTTVQRRIRSFEEELQVQLFVHTPDGYQLTAAGLLLYEQVHSLQDTVHTVSRQLVAREKELSGTVTLATTDTIGYLLMPKFVRDITEQHPELDVNLVIDNKRLDLSRLEADIAIRGGERPQESLIGKRVGKLEFCLCASRQYLTSNQVNSVSANVAEHGKMPLGEDRITLIDIGGVDYRYIKLNDEYRGLPFNQWFLQSVPNSAKSIQTNGLMSAYSLCKAGAGVAMLPKFVVGLDPDLLEVQFNEGAAPPQSELWILSHAELRNSLRIKAVKQQLFEYLSDCL